MDFIAQLSRILEPIRNKIRMMVSRSVVSLIDDSTAMQILQLRLMKDETKDGVERVQNYGFTSHPLKDSEAVVVFVNGNRDHGLVVAVDDTRYRLKGLPEGGVAMYDNDGNYVKLTKNDGIAIEAPNQKVTVKASGDIEIGNTGLKKLVNEQFQAMYNNHVHNFNTVVGVGSPVIGVTGKPASATGSGAVSVGATPAVPPTGLLGDSMSTNELSSKVKAE